MLICGYVWHNQAYQTTLDLTRAFYKHQNGYRAAHRITSYVEVAMMGLLGHLGFYIWEGIVLEMRFSSIPIMKCQ